MSDEPDDEPPTNGSRVIGLRGLRRNISREEAAQFIATASLKVGEKVYDEISKEHARVFGEMELRLNAKFEERFAALEAAHEARGWFRSLWRRVAAAVKMPVRFRLGR